MSAPYALTDLPNANEFDNKCTIELLGWNIELNSIIVYIDNITRFLVNSDDLLILNVVNQKLKLYSINLPRNMYTGREIIEWVKLSVDSDIVTVTWEFDFPTRVNNAQLPPKSIWIPVIYGLFATSIMALILWAVIHYLL